MANPVCTKASLNIACFDGTVLSLLHRKWFMVLFKVTQLALIGGTDYRNLLTSGAPGGLIGDTTALMDEKASLDEIGRRHIGQYELAVAYNTALAAGMAAQTNAQIMQSVKCLMNTRESMLDRMIVFLDCQLGVHKAYPQ